MFSSVTQSCPTLETPWIAVPQASLSIMDSRSLPKLMYIELMISSNYLILCHSLLLPPSIFPSIRVFSNESALCIRWPKYGSFSFIISTFKEYSVQFTRSVVSDSLRPHESQHTRPPCPSPSPGVHLDSRPSSP